VLASPQSMQNKSGWRSSLCLGCHLQPVQRGRGGPGGSVRAFLNPPPPLLPRLLVSPSPPFTPLPPGRPPLFAILSTVSGDRTKVHCRPHNPRLGAIQLDSNSFLTFRNCPFTPNVPPPPFPKRTPAGVFPITRVNVCPFSLATSPTHGSSKY